MEGGRASDASGSDVMRDVNGGSRPQQARKRTSEHEATHPARRYEALHSSRVRTSSRAWRRQQYGRTWKNVSMENTRHFCEGASVAANSAKTSDQNGFYLMPAAVGHAGIVARPPGSQRSGSRCIDYEKYRWHQRLEVMRTRNDNVEMSWGIDVQESNLFHSTIDSLHQ